MTKAMYTKLCLLLLLLTGNRVVSAQEEVKIMSFNIRLDVASDGENRWDARKEKVAGLMNYYEADFIGGQEVQYHQLQYLLDSLPRYRVIGVGRDDGKTAGEYSCIFYNNNTFEVVEQSTFWLSQTPDSVSMGWDAAYKRICTYGLFRSKKTEQLLWVFNTHLDHMGATARAESAKLIIQKIKTLTAGKKYPVVLTGDFNSKPTDLPVHHIQQFLKNSRDVSEQPAYGPPDTWNGFQFSKKPEGCIDYIFVSDDKRCTVKKFATLTDSYDLKYPSDHFPIIVTLQLKR